MNKIINDFNQDILFLQEVNNITSLEYIKKIKEKYIKGNNTYSHSIICVSNKINVTILLEQNTNNEIFRDIRNILLLFIISENLYKIYYN